MPTGYAGIHTWMWSDGQHDFGWDKVNNIICLHSTIVEFIYKVTSCSCNLKTFNILKWWICITYKVFLFRSTVVGCIGEQIIKTSRCIITTVVILLFLYCVQHIFNVLYLDLSVFNLFSVNIFLIFTQQLRRRKRQSGDVRNIKRRNLFVSCVH